MLAFYEKDDFKSLPLDEQVKRLTEHSDFLIKVSTFLTTAFFFVMLFGSPLFTTFTNFFQNHDYVYVSKVELIERLKDLNGLEGVKGAVRLNQVFKKGVWGPDPATDAVYTFCIDRDLVSKDVLNKFDKEVFCPEYPKGSYGDIFRENIEGFFALSRWERFKLYFEMLFDLLKHDLGLLEKK